MTDDDKNARIRELSAELERLKAMAGEMAEALDELADSAEAEIEAKRGTVLARTTERDLTEVRQARAALTRWREYEGKQP